MIVHISIENVSTNYGLLYTHKINKLDILTVKIFHDAMYSLIPFFNCK